MTAVDIGMDTTKLIFMSRHISLLRRSSIALSIGNATENKEFLIASIAKNMEIDMKKNAAWLGPLIPKMRTVPKCDPITANTVGIQLGTLATKMLLQVRYNSMVFCFVCFLTVARSLASITAKSTKDRVKPAK